MWVGRKNLYCVGFVYCFYNFTVKLISVDVVGGIVIFLYGGIVIIVGDGDSGSDPLDPLCHVHLCMRHAG